MTRILAFSDMHLSRTCAEAICAAAAEADLVIGAGDFCRVRQGLAEAMDMLRAVEAKAVYVPGNAESARELGAATGATVLHGGATRAAGLTIFGLGYGVPTTPFGDWSCDLTEAQAESMLTGLDGADIMVSHSPPKGVADQTSAARVSPWAPPRSAPRSSGRSRSSAYPRRLGRIGLYRRHRGA